MTTAALQNRYRGPAESQQPTLNLSTAERTISIATGVKLALSGFKGLFKSPFASIIKLGAGGYLLNRGFTGHCDLYARMGRNSTEPVNVNIRSSYHIDKPREEVYAFWRKLDNLPLFMKHLESVEVIDDKRSHWVLKLPTGVAKVSWDAEIVRDEPGYAIGWSSLPDSLIDNAGKVRFQDSIDGNGTLVDIVISYRPPAGGFGGGIAHIINPVFKSMVDSDVRNFKQYMDIDGGEPTSFDEPVAIIIEETIIEDNRSGEDNSRSQTNTDLLDGRQGNGAESTGL
ncbi:SRPBCC family protein [Mucilaginibacter phyllosphaerae]|uniref:DUF2892 domain-containing protein n=1 Tax=Mucilaginibacter phyllosphaerae TaxID=1812349 RepID=A0A4Y8A702_9SPHI|nr:SRPBCC family protein [Mucilaginibacter phyllosphaerae]MBB3970898.1 putative membrane protein [Mucilaginibacter phyllosphaerae]TEW64168.1 DUF2892 domain-containing protein [Mucilaginibacter phyllosphaerae]GGH05284.1 hypothetical protein GCM10007352_08990 [Mucilaginibacter phyllosphaerae]